MARGFESPASGGEDKPDNKKKKGTRKKPGDFSSEKKRPVDGAEKESSARERIVLSEEDFRKTYGERMGKKFYDKNGDWMELSDFYDEEKGRGRVDESEGGKLRSGMYVYPEGLDEMLGRYINPYPPEKMSKINMARAGTEYTMQRMKDYTELLNEEDRKNATTVNEDGTRVISGKIETKKEESERELTGLTRKLWKEFAVHGYMGFDEKGNLEFKTESDLDGKSFRKILEIAGLDISDFQYVKQGEIRKGAFTGDSGNMDGVASVNGGESLVADHHLKHEGSATKLAYELMIEMGLLEKQDYLDRFVEFVTDEDNKSYLNSELKELFNTKKQNYSRTLIGLHQYLSQDQIIEFFKSGHGHKDVLSQEELSKLTGINPQTKEEKTLADLGQDVRNRMGFSLKKIMELKEQGFVIDSGTKNFGKIVIDTGTLTANGSYINKVSLGADAVKGLGYDTLVVYVPEQDRFKVYTSKPMEFDFPQGLPVGPRYWLKPGTDGEEMKVTLDDILTKLTGKKNNVKGALKKSMAGEKAERGKLQEKVEAIKDTIYDLYDRLDKYSAGLPPDDLAGRERSEKLRQSVEEIELGKIGKNSAYISIEDKMWVLKKKEKEVNSFVGPGVGEQAESKLNKFPASPSAEAFSKEYEIGKTYYNQTGNYIIINKYEQGKVEMVVGRITPGEEYKKEKTVSLSEFEKMFADHNLGKRIVKNENIEKRDRKLKEEMLKELDAIEKSLKDTPYGKDNYLANMYSPYEESLYDRGKNRTFFKKGGSWEKAYGAKGPNRLTDKELKELAKNNKEVHTDRFGRTYVRNAGGWERIYGKGRDMLNDEELEELTKRYDEVYTNKEGEGDTFFRKGGKWERLRGLDQSNRREISFNDAEEQAAFSSISLLKRREELMKALVDLDENPDRENTAVQMEDEREDPTKKVQETVSGIYQALADDWSLEDDGERAEMVPNEIRNQLLKKAWKIYKDKYQSSYNRSGGGTFTQEEWEQREGGIKVKNRQEVERVRKEREEKLKRLKSIEKQLEKTGEIWKKAMEHNDDYRKRFRRLFGRDVSIGNAQEEEGLYEKLTSALRKEKENLEKLLAQ